MKKQKCETNHHFSAKQASKFEISTADAHRMCDDGQTIVEFGNFGIHSSKFVKNLFLKNERIVNTTTFRRGAMELGFTTDFKKYRH